MISCLTNYITMKNVGTTDPASGRYINEMPGIDTTQFDLIKKEESYSLELAWDDIERRTIRKFESRLNMWGAKYFRNYSYKENIVTGQYTDNTAVAAGTELRGLLYSDWLTSHKNLTLYIHDAHLYSDAAVTANIYIYNAATGDVLNTISHTFAANIVNRVPIIKEYPVWKYPYLFICYDTADIVSLKSRGLQFGAVTNVSEARISNTGTIITDNINGIDSAGQGLILSYSLGCSWDNFVCQRVQLFEEAFMYLLGVEFCNERLFSDRVNKYTLLNREDALKLKDYYQKQADDMLDSVLNAIPTDFGNADICFECEREANYVHGLP